MNRFFQNDEEEYVCEHPNLDSAKAFESELDDELINISLVGNREWHIAAHPLKLNVDEQRCGYDL